jgi:hypothetical protein
MALNIVWVWWLNSIILANCEAEIRRIVVCGQPRKKVHETSISISVWAQCCAPVLLALQGSTNRKIVVQANLGTVRPYLKNNQCKKILITNIKKAGRVAQVVMHLSRKQEALSSTLTQNRKKKNIYIYTYMCICMYVCIYICMYVYI